MNTLKAAGLSVVGATVFGLVFGMGRLSQNAFVRFVSGAVVEFFSAIPVLIMISLLLQHLCLQRGLLRRSQPVRRCRLRADALQRRAVMAELLSSGVHSLPSGQREAGLSVPGRDGHAAGLVSQLVVILKDTALGTVITYPDLLQQGQNLSSLHSNLRRAGRCRPDLHCRDGALTSCAGYLERRINRRGRTSAEAIPTAPIGAGADE